MFRSALRPYFALLLLLCLGRTLLPEAWVLAWHPHRHTTHESRLPKRQLLLTARHQHCHAEQFYNVPFLAGSIVRLPLRQLRARYLVRPVAQVRACPYPAPIAVGQRGPPARA